MKLKATDVLDAFVKEDNRFMALSEVHAVVSKKYLNDKIFKESICDILHRLTFEAEVLEYRWVDTLNGKQRPPFKVYRMKADCYEAYIEG